MKKQVKVILYICMAISLIACSIVGVRRINVEQNSRNVQIVIRYSDVLDIAKHSEKSVEDILKEYKDLGATTLLAKENTVQPAVVGDVYNYKEQGLANVVEGYILKFNYPYVEDIRPEGNYITTESAEVAQSIYNNYVLKEISCQLFDSEGNSYAAEDEIITTALPENQTYFIEVIDNKTALTSIGVGFNTEDLNTAASLGYSIAPQLKAWSTYTTESLEYVIEELEAINNVGTIYFSDAEVPGADKPVMIEAMKNYSLGFIEFTTNNQKGFGSLAKAVSANGQEFDVVRLHTLNEAQLKTYTVKQVLDRFDLALSERNNRAFLFKMPSTLKTEEDEAYLQECITGFIEDAQKSGYNISAEKNEYNLPLYSAPIIWLCGLGAVVIFILLASEVGLAKLGIIFGILGFIGYGGLLVKTPSFACKAMALFGAIMFPSYALVTTIQDEPRNLKDTILSFLKVCVISFGGVLTIIGTLSRTSFGLGIDVFMGVKVAHVIPIGIVLLVLIYKAHGMDYKYYFGFLQRKISYGAVIVIAVVAAALYIYTSRTGNTGSATGAELAFRQFLDSALGVRPRTKEFLIGYPILLCLLYFGYREIYLLLVIFAAIGPISLVNTYAHIHTPVLISLLRSAYGIIIGLIIGMIGIFVVNQIIKVVRKWQVKIK